jgi:hypothetical protein
MSNSYRGTKILGEKPSYQKDQDGDISYTYRGYCIDKDDCIKSGDYGSYKAWFKGSRSWFSSLSEALKAIDYHLGSPEKEEDFIKSITIDSVETKDEKKTDNPDCLEQESIDAINDESYKFLVCFSGGKDSIAMVMSLLEMGIKKERIVLHHHEVDGGGENLFDWKVTTQYCRKFADQFGLEILFSFREGGILREIYRENEGLQDILYQDTTGGEYIRLKSKLGSSTRRKFPAVAADLRTRWCSSAAKIDVLSRVMTNNKDYKTGKFIICTGERREESSNRAKYKSAELYRSNSKKRRCIQWRPILDWSEKMVWNIIETHKIQPHPCYELGWSRCSCQTCIFSSSNVWASINQTSPEKVWRLVDIELDLNHTIYNGKNLLDKTLSGESFIDSDQFMINQATKDFNLPIINNNWTLPAGAFGESSCGSV